MKAILLISTFMVCAFAGAQQSQKRSLQFIVNKEGKLTAVPEFKEPGEIYIPEASYKTYTPSNVQIEKISLVQKNFTSPYLPVFAERPMDMNVLSEAYEPFFNIYTPMLRRVSPMALDFDEYAIYPVGVNGAFMVNGRQFSWPAIGGLTTAETAIAWTNERQTISGGIFAGRYYSPYVSSPGFIGGININTRYEVNDWLALRTWGQYSYSNNNGKDPFLQMNPLLNQTNIGGAVEFKVGDNVGFGIGVNFQRNTFNNQFERQYIFYPDFGVGNDNIKFGIGGGR